MTSYREKQKVIDKYNDDIFYLCDIKMLVMNERDKTVQLIDQTKLYKEFLEEFNHVERLDCTCKFIKMFGSVGTYEVLQMLGYDHSTSNRYLEANDFRGLCSRFLELDKELSFLIDLIAEFKAKVKLAEKELATYIENKMRLAYEQAN